MNKFYSLLLISLFASKVKSQELLNANENQIKLYMKNKGIVSYDENLVKTPGITSKMLFFSFIGKTSKLSDTLSFSFFLTPNDKCDRYAITYLTRKNLNAAIKNIDTVKLGLTKVPDKLKWINHQKNFDIEIDASKSSSKNDEEIPFTIIYTYRAENFDNKY